MTASIETADRLPVAGRREVVRVLRAEMAGRGCAALLITVAMVGAAAAGLVPPLALGAVVDAVVENRGTSFLAGIAVAIVGATVAEASLAGLGLIASARLFDRLVARLRERLVERALMLPQATVEKAGSGDLLTRAGDDVGSVSDALSSVLPTFSAAVFMVAVTVVGMAALNPWLLLALAVAIPVQVVAVRYYLRTAPPIWAEAMAVASNRSNQVIGSFRGASTVIAFGLTDHHLDRIAKATWPVVRYGLLVRIVANRFFTRLTVSELSGLAGLLIVGRWLVVSGRASVGAATAGMLLVFRLFQPVRDMLLVLDTLQYGLTALTRVVGVIIAGERFATDSTDDDPHGRAGDASVELTDVSFEYHRGHPVLQGVDLAVSPCEHVALVGASGAGKTTLAMLIAGVHAASSGIVRIGGDDITTLAPRAIARRVAMISQSTHTFAGTLRDDLTLGRPDASDAEVAAALATVHASDWVAALPDGLDTVVGTHANPLTAAQQQQLALARLVLRDPAIAILDEATAEAGSSGARTLERAALAATAGRTALIVAHRLSQAAVTDRVVVMEQGAISEEGTHDDLLASGGLYSQLWDAWAIHRTR